MKIAEAACVCDDLCRSKEEEEEEEEEEEIGEIISLGDFLIKRVRDRIVRVVVLEYSQLHKKA